MYYLSPALTILINGEIKNILINLMMLSLKNIDRYFQRSTKKIHALKYVLAKNPLCVWPNSKESFNG